MPYNVAIRAYGDGENEDSEVVNSLPPTLGEPTNLQVSATNSGDLVTTWNYADSGEKDSLQLFRVYSGENPYPDWETEATVMTVEQIESSYDTTLSADKEGEYHVGVQAVGVEGLVSDPVMTSVYVELTKPEKPRTVIRMRDGDRTESIRRRSEQGYGSRHFRARYGRVLMHDYFMRPSRYDGHRIVTLVTDDGQSYRTLETWERPVVPAAGGPDERYFYVDNTFAHRSDRVAKVLHGDENLRWWVLQSNGLFEDEQLVHGMTLRVIRPPSEQAPSLTRSPI